MCMLLLTFKIFEQAVVIDHGKKVQNLSLTHLSGIVSSSYHLNVILKTSNVCEKQNKVTKNQHLNTNLEYKYRVLVILPVER